MPFQKGNQLGAKAARWRNAIDKALECESKAEGQEKLVEIAKELLKLAQGGDLAAIKELGDRMDGRPAQSVYLGGDEEHPLIHEVRRTIVDP